MFILSGACNVNLDHERMRESRRECFLQKTDEIYTSVSNEGQDKSIHLRMRISDQSRVSINQPREDA